ncbi:hypothetical protein JKF63_06348 [Porcisia hertigi]|uniref:Uncharacterized protein n=1 Tax=Porcisia hertigi TaxID=2761500 RepID=A0A836IUC3_9TRYP|nr:hypothetical protein JKF63_06348 [Porcisia hertigi]
MSEACAMAGEATLTELVSRCCCCVAELILGEGAAADVGGYRSVYHTRWLERCSLVAGGGGTVGEAELHPGQQHECSPAEHLISQLARIFPLLQPAAGGSNSACGDGGALAPSLARNVGAGVSETSPSWQSAFAPPPPTWWDGVADALDALFSAVDDVCVDSVGVSSSTVCSSALSLPPAVLGGESLSQIEAALTEKSCIMAGLLLHRDVLLRSGPCYTAVVSPVLVALDLDGTLLRSPLSSISLRAALAATAAEVRALFVDADFLGAFCEAVTRHGHELAICSLTEGAADQWATCLSVAETVLCLLSRVLPPIRAYLTSTDDVVCVPRSVAGPGKLYHLQELQQRRNSRDEGPHPLRRPMHPDEMQQRVSDTGASPSSAFLYPSHDDDIVREVWGQSTTLMPKWLSTDMVLIDDDRENCRTAVTQGYHATPCSETGMSAAWYAANPELQVLLGTPASEVVPRNSA